MYRRIAIPLLIFALIPSCTRRTHDHEHEHETHEHAHEAHVHAHDAAAHDHTGLIELEDEAAERFGVEIDTLRLSQYTPAVRAAATVLPAGQSDAVVAAPVAGIVRFAPGMERGRQVSSGAVIASIDATAVSGGDTGAAAKAALEAARAEYERIERLYSEQLATVTERNAALAALRQAEAAYSPAATAGRATSPIAGIVTDLTVRQGQYVAAGDVIATVNSDRELTIRVDLPRRYYPAAATYTDAIVTLPYDGGTIRLSDIGGKRTGTPVMSTASASAYVPVYFTVPRHAGIIPGGSLTVHLSGSGTVEALTVPVTALSEQQGEFFVYEALGGEHYVKHRVDVLESDGRTARIAGLPEGTPLVVKGVTTVRLAENGANIPEGHTHNH